MKSLKEIENGEIQKLLQQSIRQALEEEEEMNLSRKRPLIEGQWMPWIEELDIPLPNGFCTVPATSLALYLASPIEPVFKEYFNSFLPITVVS